MYGRKGRKGGPCGKIDRGEFKMNLVTDALDASFADVVVSTSEYALPFCNILY